MKAVFIDTTGWFSLLNCRDAWHEAARATMRKLGRRKVPLITTDYVADETATLLKVRGAGRVLDGFFDQLESSRALTLTPVGLNRFHEARHYFLKQRDHRYSFTDTTSFVVMRELRLREAFTHDAHFEEAGFVRLLA